MNGNYFHDPAGRALLAVAAGLLMTPLKSSGLEARTLQARVQAVAAHAAESCVSIHSLPRDSWGSGVIVSAEGHLFTAAHVVSTVGEVTEARLSDGAIVLAEVLAIDHEMDAAVLQFAEFRPAANQIAPIACEDPALGDACVGIGHALGYDAGRSAPVRLGFLGARTQAGNLLTTCRMAVGDSGGALFSLSGELLAIHRTVDAGGEFAAHIPVSELTKRFAAAISLDEPFLVAR